MSLAPNRILVLLDGGSHCQEALQRACLVAEETDQPLDVLWFGARPLWQGVEDTLAQQHGDRTTHLLDPTTSLFETLRREWVRESYSLVVKGCDPGHGRPGLTTPLDWRLLREVPAPVLLVKRLESWVGGRVLAAINPLHDGAVQRALDTSVLRTAQLICSLAQAQLHTVVATEPPMLGASAEDQVASLISARAEASVQALCQRLQLSPQQHHIGEGPAEFWISQVSNDLNAALLVISTSARAGVSGTLFGNTAEDILDRTETDVLVMRAGTEVLDHHH
ncbi:universal stress protein [Marinobacterium rhizophilum]|uniref:Universal stress protein n=1 Tax=Marinobacterium rhizophilum TaxID=420402 RepID=A0ABY5HFR9_9GAMM|nr:universal stress protein [Marinobacterium rhizophilum]UTW10115.1 universal stress protein [Marinobacterium rhizophilum]